MKKSDRIGKIVEAMDDQSVSAYEIAQNTSLTPKGIQKIKDRITENPRDSTLKEIEIYLGINYTENNLSTKTNESSLDEIDLLARQVQDNWEELSQRESFKGFFYYKVAQILNMDIDKIFADAIKKGK